MACEVPHLLLHTSGFSFLQMECVLNPKNLQIAPYWEGQRAGLAKINKGKPREQNTQLLHSQLLEEEWFRLVEWGAARTQELWVTLDRLSGELGTHG